MSSSELSSRGRVAPARKEVAPRTSARRVAPPLLEREASNATHGPSRPLARSSKNCPSCACYRIGAGSSARASIWTTFPGSNAACASGPRAERSCRAHARKGAPHLLRRDAPALVVSYSAGSAQSSSMYQEASSLKVSMSATGTSKDGCAVTEMGVTRLRVR